MATAQEFEKVLDKSDGHRLEVGKVSDNRGNRILTRKTARPPTALARDYLAEHFKCEMLQRPNPKKVSALKSYFSSAPPGCSL